MDEDINSEQFGKISVNGVTFEINKRNSCKTSIGEIVILRNVINRQCNVIFIENIFTNISDNYEYFYLYISFTFPCIVKGFELNQERLEFTSNKIYLNVD